MPLEEGTTVARAEVIRTFLLYHAPYSSLPVDAHQQPPGTRLNSPMLLQQPPMLH
jgi:hypothetical protein